MEIEDHYGLLLGINSPWEISSVDLDLATQKVDVIIEYTDDKGPCPECGVIFPKHDDRKERTWRHLDTMQFATQLHCKLPRVRCKAHGAKSLNAPWAGENSRFTLLFEAFAVRVLIAARSVEEARKLLGLNWHQVEAIKKRAVERGLSRRKEEAIPYIGIDEKGVDQLAVRIYPGLHSQIVQSLLMNTTIRLQGRVLTPNNLDFIRQLIAENTTFSRRKLSIALCEAWNWRNARGDIKDMASRALMLKLHERGEIVLPARRRAPSNRMKQREIVPIEHSTNPITERLKSLQPLRVVNVQAKSSEEKLYNHLLATYHYLSYKSTVGENMKYLIFDNANRPVACLLFGSSAWSSKVRDNAVSWSSEVRQHNINYTTNNTRFLILPWVRVPHLASHLLALISRRINRDWKDRYNHAVYLLETFVDKSRFKGTCYIAANWLRVGDTQGRSRNDQHGKMSVPIKTVLLYPLDKNYKHILSAKIEP